MTLRKSTATTAATVAMVAVSLSILLTACEGRRASNMKPTGETIEVNIPVADDSTPSSILPTDSI